MFSEKVVGKDSGGVVDFVWINGENFVVMKENGFLVCFGWVEIFFNW